MKARHVGLIVLVVLITVPIAEIWLLLRIGSWVGVWPTLALLLGTAALGAWLARREGTRSWRALVEASGRGELPTREITDAALVLVGGILLMLPGVVTDVLGLVCLLPFTRFLPRALVRALAGSGSGPIVVMGGRGDSGHETVIPGEVVDEADASRTRQQPDDPGPALEGRILD